MRLIDADELLKKAYKSDWNWHDRLHTEKQKVVDVEDIDEAPTIEAEPVKHGHWIDKTTWFGGIGKCKYECSNCGYTIDYDPKSRGDKRGGNYCDDCGAKMDGGVDNE